MDNLKIHTIDLQFLNKKACVAAFVVSDGQTHCLVETGPYSTIHNLKSGLQELNIGINDLSAVFLSHIHFDHAGAAWYFASNGVPVYVHPMGYKHLCNPERLVQSATMIYGDQMDSLWGEMKAIKPEMLFTAEHDSVIQVGNVAFKALHTPGHANHHIAWEVDDFLFTGDAAGISIMGGPIQPPVPPPDIDIEKWRHSIEIMRASPCRYLYLTHFGKYENNANHWDTLLSVLNAWSAQVCTWVEQGKDLSEITPAFESLCRSFLEAQSLSPEIISAYESANPPFMGAMGLYRYCSKNKPVNH